MGICIFWSAVGGLWKVIGVKEHEVRGAGRLATANEAAAAFDVFLGSCVSYQVDV